MNWWFQEAYCPPNLEWFQILRGTEEAGDLKWLVTQKLDFYAEFFPPSVQDFFCYISCNFKRQSLRLCYLDLSFTIFPLFAYFRYTKSKKRKYYFRWTFGDIWDVWAWRVQRPLARSPRVQGGCDRHSSPRWTGSVLSRAPCTPWVKGGSDRHSSPWWTGSLLFWSSLYSLSKRRLWPAR